MSGNASRSRRQCTLRRNVGVFWPNPGRLRRIGDFVQFHQAVRADVELLRDGGGELVPLHDGVGVGGVFRHALLEEIAGGCFARARRWFCRMQHSRLPTFPFGAGLTGDGIGAVASMPVSPCHCAACFSSDTAGQRRRRGAATDAAERIDAAADGHEVQNQHAHDHRRWKASCSARRKSRAAAVHGAPGRLPRSFFRFLNRAMGISAGDGTGIGRSSGTGRRGPS